MNSRQENRSKFSFYSTGSPSAICVGSGFRGHLVEFGRNILELLVYYLNTIKEGKAGVQYSMERKSTKRRLNRLWDTEWL